MRYLPFALIFAFTVWLIVDAASDFVFGDTSIERLLKRCALAIVWPLALVSKSGRDMLFNRREECHTKANGRSEKPNEMKPESESEKPSESQSGSAL